MFNLHYKYHDHKKYDHFEIFGLFEMLKQYQSFRTFILTINLKYYFEYVKIIRIKQNNLKMILSHVRTYLELYMAF